MIREDCVKEHYMVDELIELCSYYDNIYFIE